MAILVNVKNKIGKLADRGANMIATAFHEFGTIGDGRETASGIHE